jgi:hypothetical protein
MHTSLNHLPKLCPVAELHRWIIASRDRYQALRLSIPFARAGVKLAIAEDCIAESNELARMAHCAETADREALTLLDSLLADGVFTAAQRATVHRVRAHVARSAEHDHDLAERTTISTTTP